MDGAFACPECGQDVVVHGTAPGRHVRCGFCNRLLEVPFLPRVGGEWKRTRPTRPRWIPWAWWGVSLAVVAIVATGLVQAVIRGERAARGRTIDRLLESSKSHESEGRLDLALLDLDSALQVAPPSEEAGTSTDLRERRRDLARRDVSAVLGALSSDGRESKSVGDWLNLVARVGSDRDLVSARGEVEGRFFEALRRWIAELADRAGREADPSSALARCFEGADLAAHLPKSDRGEATAPLRAIVESIVARRGIAIEAEPGTYVMGTAAGYNKALNATMVESLRAKGYVPPPPSRWKDLWSAPPFRLAYAIRETREGTYMGTQNRLSRIEARLTLTDRGHEIWKTVPQARTIVPLPSLPSYLAGRLALGQDRVDEAEKMLYDNAFSQIRDKFQFSLNNLPGCPAASLGAH